MPKYIVFMIVLSSLAQAGIKPKAISKKENCVIVTTTEYYDGEITENIQSFEFKTKKECEEVRKTLSNNFSPKDIKKFSAKMNWTENE